MAAPDTLYLKIDQNVVVDSYQVCLQDLASMECTNEAVLRQLKQKKIYTFPRKDTPNGKKHRIQVFSVLKIIQQIHEDYPNLEVQNVGESDFLIECNAGVTENKPLQIAKTAKLHPFVAGKYMKQCRTFGRAELCEIMEEAASTEEMVKTGRLNDVMSVEIFIVKFSA